MRWRPNSSFAAGLVLFLALPMFFLSTRCAAASNRAAIGGPDPREFGAMVKKGCLAELYPADDKFDAFRHVRHCIEAWTEYERPPSCKPISPGKYKIPSQPKHGTISTGVVGGLRLGNGECQDHTYDFKFAYYNWTDDNENYDCLPHAPPPGDDTAACDLFQVNWYTPDGQFDEPFPLRANLAPRINGRKNVWWFGNDMAGNPISPPGYRTTIELTAYPPGYTYQWSVTVGNEVTLENPTANPVRVRSTTFSPIEDGKKHVQIRVSGEFGGPSNPHRLTVQTPYYVVNFRNHDFDNPAAPEGFTSHISFQTYDQFDDLVNSGPLPINEHFDTQSQPFPPVPPGYNWRHAPPAPGPVNPANWIDYVGFGAVANEFQPVPQHPAPGSNLLTCADAAQRVDRWAGQWRAGSVVEGDGVVIERAEWTRWLSRGRHCHIQPPSR